MAYYSSADLIHWEYEGALDIPSVNGFMLECPDYFELNDQGILIFVRRVKSQMEIIFGISSRQDMSSEIKLTLNILKSPETNIRN